MSASVLRQAAALMRERAQAVTSGAQWTDGHYWIADYDPSDPSGQTGMQRLIGGMDAPDHQHYSSWHPAVAHVVADWLDIIADRDPLGQSVEAEPALAVARTYLGDPA